MCPQREYGRHRGRVDCPRCQSRRDLLDRTRYLLVEIFLVRDDDKDAGFKPAVEAKSKELQDVTINTLRRYNAEDLSDPVIQDTIKDRLKALYQAIIGADHPIDKMVVPKWIMQ